VVLTVEAGTTFLMHPDVGFSIGTLSNGNTALMVNGTAAQPVTFTRLDDTSNPWGSIQFALDNDAAGNSHLSHTHLLYGGGDTPENREAVLEQLGHGTLTLDHVEVKFSANAGVYAGNGSINVTDSRFELNREGLHFLRTFGLLRRNVIQNNSAGWPNQRKLRNCLY
jgi:hypothetical protein